MSAYVAARGPPVVFGTVGFHPYVVRDQRWLRVDGEDHEVPLEIGSDRWFDLFEHVHRTAPDPRVVHVMDREGDGYDLLAVMDAREASFVVRSAHDRTTAATGEKLSAVLSAQEVVVDRDVVLGPRSDAGRPPASRARFPERVARRARLRGGRNGANNARA